MEFIDWWYLQAAKDAQKIVDISVTNAALADRVTELEAALDAAQDDAARLRAALECVEFVSDDVCTYCPWCNADDRDHEPGVDMDYTVKHKPDCQRQAALAQTTQTSEVKA